MITGKTSTGFEFAFSQDVVNDMRMLRAIGKMENGDAESIDYVGKKLLGQDKYDKLLDHIQTEDGRQPIDALLKEVAEMFSAFQQQTGKK